MPTQQPENIKTTTAIAVQGVRKDFLKGKVQALRGVDVQVKKGEVVIIFGPSGCGKSTLLGLMAGFEPPTAGKVYLDNIDVNQLTPNQAAFLRRDNVGMVFQQFNLVQSLSAIDNVALPLILAGIKRGPADKRASQMLDSVNLSARKNHKPNQLSGGEQQRVAIARALIDAPDVLLLDEPTGNLDEANSQEILKLTQQVNKWGTAIVMVTHNPDFLKIADRVYQMRDGQIVKVTTNRRVAAPPEKEERDAPTKEQLKGALRFKETIRLALAHMRNKPIRTFFATLGVSLGVGAVVGLVSLGIGLQQIATDQITSFSGLVTIGVTATENSANPLDDNAAKKISEIKHIKLVSPNITLPSQVTLGETSTALVATGIKEDALNFEGVKLTAGKNDGAIMTRAAIKSFNIKDDNEIIGKQIKIALVEAPTENAESAESALGQLQAKTLDITVSGVSNDEVLGVVYVPIDNIKSAIDSNVYTSINAQVDSRKNVATTRDEIGKLGYATKSVVDLINQVDRVFLIAQVIMGTIGGVALLVALLGVVNIMTIALLERTHEIGILKSFGATNRDIRRIFSTEASLLGVIGGIIGVALAWLVGLGINGLLNILMKASGGEQEKVALFILPIGFAIAMIILSYFVALLAGWFPSRHAAKLSAMEALRYE